MLGSLRNTGRPRFATSAFRLAMLRCCVRSRPGVAFALAIICQSPINVGNLTARVRTVNHAATLYVGSVRYRAGRVFTRQTPPLHRAEGGMFRVITALPPSGAHPHSFPGRAPFVTTYF